MIKLPILLSEPFVRLKHGPPCLIRRKSQGYARPDAPARPLHFHRTAEPRGGTPRRSLLAPFATCSRRSSVSGYWRTRSTSAAAWGLGLARPCSHFSRVLRLM